MGESVTVDAAVEDVSSDTATVTRSASIADVVQDPRDVLNETSFDTDFELYERLMEIDPELAGAIRGQSQLATGFNLIHPAVQGDDEEPNEREKTALKECRRLVKKLNLELDQPSIFARMVAMGNDINKIVYSEGRGVEKLQSLPLRHVTILDDETDEMANRAYRAARKESGAESNEEELDLDIYNEHLVDSSVQEAKWYYLNEGTAQQKRIPSWKILHFAVEKRSHWWEDQFGRPTYGVWGRPRIEPTKFSLQAKHNTLTNKVALDDSLIAREIYKIDVEALFGHIKNDEKREEKAENYTEELKTKLEDLGPGEQPILPKEVEVEVKGPQGKAKDQADFLQMMNDSIMHALTFHVGGVGRDAGGPMIGNRPAKDVSQNNVRHLRKVVGHKLRDLFEMHLKLLHSDETGWVDKHGETGEDADISQWELNPDIVLPTVRWNSLEEGDMERKANVATKSYNSKLLTRNEAREVLGFDPLDEDEVDKLFQDMKKTQELNQQFQKDDSGEEESSAETARSTAGPPVQEQDDNSGFAGLMTKPYERARQELEQEAQTEGVDE